MGIKLLHTGDVHIGAGFLGLGVKGSQQRAQLYDTFKKLVGLAVDQKVGLVLIAGDLFDSNLVSRTAVAQVASQLQDLTVAGIPVCVSPGTHDPYGRDSVYSQPPLSEIDGLTVFTSEQLLPARFPELECTVYGNANTRPFNNKHPLEGFRPDDTGGWRVGLTHANFEVPDLVEEDTYIVTRPQVADSALDYLALGHLHSYSDRSSGGVVARYCGSPEMVRLQKGDFGNVVIVELSDSGVSAAPVAVGTRSFEQLTVQAESLDSTAGMFALLESRANPDRVLRVSIEGVRGISFPDVDSIVEELSVMFFDLAVTDRSVPAAGDLDPASYPETSPTSVFLRILEGRLAGVSDQDRDDVLEAMRLGASLLEAGGLPGGCE